MLWSSPHPFSHALFTVIALLGALITPAAAQTCTADDIAAAVDGAGAQLRAFNSEASPKLQARLKALAAKKGWTDQEFEEKAITDLSDDRLKGLDETANTLLARIDTLGQLKPGETADCARLDEIRNSGVELLTVMKSKSAYLLTRIDAELGTKTAAAPPATPPAAPPALKETLPAPVAPPSPPAAKTEPKKPSQPSWNTTTANVPPKPAPASPPVEVAVLPPPPAPPPGDPSVPRPQASMAQPPAVFEKDDGYTIDEIRDATRGFFGSVSTGLAAVIEHAFQQSGRPTGYVLGQEGGGAFLGGLRYGEGTVYLRTGGTQKIYWHGPSVGFDFGAAGARTMFLIYKMHAPEDLYRVFTGIDGSAFVVGGVGLTLLGGGDMVLAPIRSGLGVRVGANIGYLRFTPTQTWNPF